MKTKTKKPSSLTDEIDEFLSEAEEEGGGGGEPESEEEGWGLPTYAGEAPPEEEEDEEERVVWELNEGDSWDNIIYDPKKMKWERQIKTAMLRRTNALLLLGESGVGKTTMLKKAAERYLDTPLSYFNVPNMDPFIHLVGLPHIDKDPKTETLVLAFVKKSGVEGAELLVLDEINRADPRTQNTLFELVNTREVNGERLGKLEMVWGAMNPPRMDIEVNVQRLERAFQGRFKKVIVVLAKPKMRHYVFPGGEISEWAARVCLRWWYQTIEKKGAQGIQFQDIITPRVLEYIMETVQFLEDWRQGRVNKRHGPLTKEEWNDEFETITQHQLLITDDSGASIGQGIPVPWAALRSAIRGQEMPGLTDLLDTSKVLPRVLDRMKRDPKAAKMVASTIRDGIKTTRRQPIPQMEFYEIGQFSKVLTAMKPDDANIIISGKPEVAGFLAAKVIGDDAAKRKYSKNNMEHKVWLPATPGEIAIFNHLKYPIMMAVKRSAEYEPGAVAAKPGAGAPAPAPAAGAAGAATPAAPPARPGSVPPPARPGSVPPSAKPGAVPPKKPGVP